MSKKWASDKGQMKLWENWRRFLAEEEEEAPGASKMDRVAKILANPGTSLANYVSVLKRYAGDPEFDKLASAGQTDGEPSDERVAVDRTAVPAKSLTATQAEIGFSNSLEDQMINKFKGTETALGLKGDPITMGSKDGPVPLLVWNSKYILDGHHRWSQVMMTNPDGKVVIDNVTGPEIDNEEEALKAMQMAIAVEADAVKTKPFEGENLMKSSPQEVYQYVMANITDEVLQLLVQAGKIAQPKKELAAKYVAGNVPVIKASAGRFSREKSMPQAGHSGASQDAVNDLLGTGKVNFDKPSEDDVKGSHTGKLGPAGMKGARSGFRKSSVAKK